METISESTFLITELRYTLGQLHVQVLDLDAETRKSLTCGDRSIEQILSDMLEGERRWQDRYAQLLGGSVAKPEESQTEIPLPVTAEEETHTVESEFEHRRAQTIAMLEALPEPWPAELVESVKQQVTEDRQLTTSIADCRKAYFAEDQRPDLNKPLAAPH